MNGYGQEVREQLRKAGCWFIRHGRGDHDIWRSPLTNRSFTVPVKIMSRQHGEWGFEGRGATKGLLGCHEMTARNEWYKSRGMSARVCGALAIAEATWAADTAVRSLGCNGSGLLGCQFD
jgi:hypothetical protein